MTMKVESGRIKLPGEVCNALVHYAIAGFKAVENQYPTLDELVEHCNYRYEPLVSVEKSDVSRSLDALTKQNLVQAKPDKSALSNTGSERIVIPTRYHIFPDEDFWMALGGAMADKTSRDILELFLKTGNQPMHHNQIFRALQAKANE